jgi:glyoxylase-like metal-dependent hydrolase (beta-lactamase superfamily II)
MWQEIAEGVYRRRYESLDLNVGVVIGGEGVLVIDTRASHRQAQQVLDELRTLTRLPPRWVLNTHYHWDHCWGNALFPAAQLWGHERCRTALINDGEAARAGVLERLAEEHRADVEEVVITAPDHTFGIRHAIDLGGRIVEFKYLGLGHTDSDVVVQVADSGTLFAGDLIEEGAPPSFSDSFPLNWPETLDALLEMTTGVVVPGHGDIVDRAFIETQRAEISALAALARAGFVAGESIDEVDVHTSPYPEEPTRTAIQRAFLQLED